MKRGPRLGTIAVASLASAMMVPTMYEPTPRVKPLPNVPDHRTNAKKWTCKRCGEKFTPHRSPTYCDRCQEERMKPAPTNTDTRIRVSQERIQKLKNAHYARLLLKRMGEWDE